jgi:hypothetical protein
MKRSEASIASDRLTLAAAPTAGENMRGRPSSAPCASTEAWTPGPGAAATRREGRSGAVGWQTQPFGVQVRTMLAEALVPSAKIAVPKACSLPSVHLAERTETLLPL